MAANCLPDNWVLTMPWVQTFTGRWTLPRHGLYRRKPCWQSRAADLYQNGTAQARFRR
jgi:hypothetical protein